METLTRNLNDASGDFRHLLQQELLKRCKNNPMYSLRAFARALRIEPSALSSILRNKRPITEKMKRRLGIELGLTPVQLKKFQIPARKAKDLQKSKLDFQKITLDTFAIISDWYHYAILELTH